MLINLSNHPLKYWTKKQYDSAIELYEDVMDMEFPAIAPYATEEEIKNLANDFLQKILELNKQKNIVVHIMGEMTFSFCLIKLLQNENILCVASTTERNVYVEENGNKVSQFNFVKFRKYE
ncbi:MAG: hypothetical protein HUK18_04595 [Bacteroidales bacterium]|nr:hypothetical protein [Bacteroidales bacterium]